MRRRGGAASSEEARCGTDVTSAFLSCPGGARASKEGGAFRKFPETVNTFTGPLSRKLNIKAKIERNENRELPETLPGDSIARWLNWTPAPTSPSAAARRSGTS